MADLSGFRADEVEPTGDFEVLPAGSYAAILVNSAMKPTKSGTGHYLELTFEILDGPHKGRRLWARLNLSNANELTVQIAKAELSALCRAVNVLAPNDSTELHNIPLIIKVGVKRRNDTQELSNVIRGYAGKTTAAVATASQRTSASSTPPWKR